MTVCNQNRVSCRKLHERMLEQLSVSTEDEDSKILVDLYNLTRCGVDGLGCPEVFELYHKFYKGREEIFPAKLMEKDECLDCTLVFLEYVNKCFILKQPKPTQILTYLWQKGNCYSMMKDEPLNLHFLSKYSEFKDEMIQESLDNCPCLGRECLEIPSDANTSNPSANASWTASEVDPLSMDFHLLNDLDVCLVINFVSAMMMTVNAL